MIHVAYRLWGGDGFYAKMLGTSMLSMFENTNEKVTVHVMHNDRLTPDNRGKFCYIAGQYGQQVEFHNVEEIAGATLKKFDAVHPIKSGINAAWYPLIVHEVFPDLDKIIFLGADTVINLDIGEMWAYDLDGLKCPLGAVSEYFLKKSVVNPICQDGYAKHEDYFNTDVLLLKPDFFREEFDKILEACKFIGKNRKRYHNAENDVLVFLYYKDYLRLPDNFNMMVNHLKIHRPQSHYKLEKALYHFSDSHYRMSLNTDDAFNRLYLEYFMKTPWANADMFGNIDKAVVKTVEQLFNESRNILLNVTNLLVKRRRAFLVDKEFQKPARQIFEISDDEFITDFSTGAENLIRELNANKGKLLLFILEGNYLQVRYFLLSQNFIEGTDFINGFLFLSERQGFKMNFDTKYIVQAM